MHTASPLDLRTILFCSAMGLASFAPPALAEDVPPCPESIRVDQKLAEPVAGWDAPRDAVTHRLMAIEFYSGHPNERESLLPDSTAARGPEHVARWAFGSGSRGTWMACLYDRTSVLLARRLAAGVRSCEVATDPLVRVGGRPKVVRVTCR